MKTNFAASTATPYGFQCALKNTDFVEGVMRVTEALKAEGFMDPMAVLQMTDSAEVAKVAQDVHQRLQRVRASPLTMTASTQG